MNNGFCLDELSRGERIYGKSRKIDKKIPENGNSYNPCSGDLLMWYRAVSEL